MGAARQWAGLLPALLLLGCATLDEPGPASPLMAADPMAAYSAARIAEGAYLASGHVDPAVLARLLVLDQRARSALDEWQSGPSGAGIVRVRMAMAELTDYLLNDAQF